MSIGNHRMHSLFSFNKKRLSCGECFSVKRLGCGECSSVKRISDSPVLFCILVSGWGFVFILFHLSSYNEFFFFFFFCLQLSLYVLNNVIVINTTLRAQE